MSQHESMAIIARTPGGPRVLEWAPVETAPPGPGEALIEQRAIGVNFIDTYYRRGVYAWPTTPLIPGGEAAGIVAAVGPGVTEVGVGDRVAYTVPLGAYREWRVLPAERLVRLPDAIGFDVAASVLLKGLTAQFLVTSCFPVKRGDRVLVHAAAGGVGLLLGQWLRAVGAVAIGTVGAADKVKVAQAHGFAHVVNYRADDFAAHVHELTAGRGCDVVYDSVGEDTWRGSLKCLKWRGTFVSFGQSSGIISGFKVADLAAGGSLYATRPTLFDYIAAREELQQRAADLFAHLADGTVEATVGQTLPLREAARAHEALESRRTIGATVLLA